jgi:hypothetical protein
MPIPVSMLNSGSEDVTITKGTVIALVSEADYVIEGIEEVVDDSTCTSQESIDTPQVVDNRKIMQALKTKLDGIEATLAHQNARKQASTIATPTSLTLDEQELRLMYSTFVDSRVKEQRSKAHDD